MDEKATGDAKTEGGVLAPNGGAVDITGIMTAIPHRYPFLLIDRMVDVVLGESADQHEQSRSHVGDARTAHSRNGVALRHSRY